MDSKRQLIVDAVDASFKSILTTTFLPVASLSIPLALTKLSAINGTAFLDCGSLGAALLARLGDKVTIADSAGKKITGFIKAAGTGETTGANLLTRWENLDSIPYESFASVGPNLSVAMNMASGDGLALSNTLDAAGCGKLFKLACTETLNSGVPPWLNISNGTLGDGVYTSARLTANGANTFYQCSPFAAPVAALQNSYPDGTNFAMAGFEIRQVLTPAATGVTITSVSGGTTYNWATKDAAFNYADPLGYTIDIATPYQTDIGANVEWWVMPAIDQDILPAVCLKDRDNTSWAGIGQHLHALDIQVEIYLKPEYTAAADVMRQVIADITTAIRLVSVTGEIDTTWGGLAQDTSLLNERGIFIEEKENCLVAIGLVFTIAYTTLPWNAYQ